MDELLEWSRLYHTSSLPKILLNLEKNVCGYLIFLLNKEFSPFPMFSKIGAPALVCNLLLFIYSLLDLSLMCVRVKCINKDLDSRMP